ncbi:YdcH family protein [Ancylobacter sp.]|uniref:YdcH family protein n=1 Tax=Ancylobacter sp. TaxID=1872567 RepID=UPI003D142A5C
MTADEEREFQDLLEHLRQEHRDLDIAIQALQDMPGSDQLQLARLKKRKLQLRDRIGYIEDQICPDIIA